MTHNGSAQSSQGGARVRIPPPLVFLAAVLAGAGLQYLLELRLPLPLLPRLELAGLFIAGGLALGATAIGLFRKTGQDPKPWLPTPELILRGPYKYMRNPMYLSMTLFTAGIGVAFGNIWVVLLAPAALAAVHFIAVLPEERYLAEKFGDAYLQYKLRVRRYL
jgi:protein-S-isoprenylcysteine O-methyltransferase Ste14